MERKDSLMLENVDSAKEKLRTLIQDRKASENKFNYFYKNSCAATNITFQRVVICQQEIQQLAVEEQLCKLSEGDCNSPVQSENPCRIKQEPEIFNKCLLQY
jgi:hypothetical protein